MEDILANLRGFPVDPGNIISISTPADFYNELLNRSKSAQKRIVFTSLYLGSGELEKNLVGAIENSLKSTPNLRVSVLLDFLRGTRGTSTESSSTSVLKCIADRAKIYLYHTPNLSGFMKRILGERTNEIVGLQHMKIYIIDDSVIISGANLSDSYFTNRQDRYVLFENCGALADFLEEIVEAVGEYSFQLKPDGSTELHPKCAHHPFQGSSRNYIENLRNRVESVMNSVDKKICDDTNASTFVYPLLQMGPIGISQEHEVLKKILSMKEPDMSLTLASGYFNCIDEYERILLKDCTYPLDIITAAPLANGFYGASGFSGYIPSMYSWVATQFLDKIKLYNREKVALYEYSRDHWTFHAKGLWIDSPKWYATLVGSSNYGYRSVHRDLEAQMLVVTRDEDLKNRLKEERSRLMEHTSVLDTCALRRSDHHIPTLVRFVSKFVRNFF